MTCCCALNILYLFIFTQMVTAVKRLTVSDDEIGQNRLITKLFDSIIKVIVPSLKEFCYLLKTVSKLLLFFLRSLFLFMSFVSLYLLVSQWDSVKWSSYFHTLSDQSLHFCQEDFQWSCVFRFDALNSSVVICTKYKLFILKLYVNGKTMFLERNRSNTN